MKRPARIALGLAVGGALAVAGVEVILRVFQGLMPEQALLRMHWAELVVGNETRSQADRELGFVFSPDRVGEYDLKDLSFEYGIDAKGFRNASPWPEEAEIVVVGDSLAFGYGVPDDETWSHRVDEQLEGARLINLALPGYCPEQATRAYEHHGAALSPKLLIVGVFPTNDVKDQGKFKRWLEEGAPGNYDIWRFSGGTPSFLKSTYLYNFLVEHQKLRDQGYKGSTLLLDDGPLRLTPSLINSSAKNARLGQPDFEDAVRSIGRARREARKAGARVLILLFPCKEEVYLPALGGETPEPVRPFVETFEERGWEHLDLTPIFAERVPAMERLYFEIDGHPNARGNRLTAEAVLAWIAANAPELQ